MTHPVIHNVTNDLVGQTLRNADRGKLPIGKPSKTIIRGANPESIIHRVRIQTTHDITAQTIRVPVLSHSIFF